MSKKEKIVSKVKFTMINSNGTYSIHETVMPIEVANSISLSMDWEGEWRATLREAREYFEAEKKAKFKHIDKLK
jgi:hypothetical protein